MKLRTGLELVVFLFAVLSPPPGVLGAEKSRLQQHPIMVLEVFRPPDVPAGATEMCAQVLVHHVFGNTIDEAPVVRPYSPSPSCGQERWSRVVLRWTASSTGRQFDRISAVWLGGVEILRTCTAEPVKHPGIEWTVEKDVTRYSSLWQRLQMVAVELANVLVADSLTGTYDVTLSVHFFVGGDSDAAAKPFEFKSSSGGATEAESKPFAFKSSYGATEAESKPFAAFKSSGGATEAESKRFGLKSSRGETTTAESWPFAEFKSSRGGTTESESKPFAEFKSARGETKGESKPFAFKSSRGATEAESTPLAEFKSSSGGATEAESAEFKSSGYGDGRVAADVILPFPSSTPDHYWFRIHDESDAQTRRIRNIPRNAYKATLELCVSFHDRDEFWYANKPNKYFASNNFTDTENGPFREILVTIDDHLAGAVHPFPVIYTGGVNPFFWRPVTAIGSFVLPSYDIDITPFLAEDVHTFTVSVTNALPFWLLGLNVHIWVDENLSHTRGAMMHHSTSISTSLENLNFLALDGTFLLKTSRLLLHSSWLVSSYGNLTTEVEFSAHFSNALTVSDSGNAFSVHQESVIERKSVVKSDERGLVYEHELYRFPLRLSVHQFPCCGEETLLQKAYVDHAWEEERQYNQVGYGGVSSFSTLKNRQQSRGKLFVAPVGENRGVATTKQSFIYGGSGGCYSRSIAVGNNGSYLFDHSHTRCT